jgi:hypothetical protein
MSNIIKFPKRVSELERDYMPIRREQLIVKVQAEKRSSFWTTALVSAAVFTIYGLMLLTFAEVI